jgi:hypothetical protein
VVVLCVLAAGSYTAVALSSLPQRVARRSPEQASMFRPPWFNFLANYDEGNVLGFEIGSNHEQWITTFFSKFATGGELDAACGRAEGARPLSVAESSVTASQVDRVRELAQGKVVCLFLPARRIVLIFRFSDDALRTIELSFVRNDIVT